MAQKRLELFLALRGVPHRIRLGMQSDPARTRDAQVADTAGADTSGAPPPSRIQRLAALRNVALEPMLAHAATDGPRFHRIVFLNDVCSGFLKFNTCLQGEEAVLHQTLFDLPDYRTKYRTMRAHVVL